MTRRYGLLRGPTSSSCGGLWPSAAAFYAVLDQSKKVQKSIKTPQNKKNKNGPKIQKSRKIPRNLKKSLFFKNKMFWKKKNCQKKNAILLVFQYQEDAIQPELSRPARFRNIKISKNLKNSFFFNFFFILFFVFAEKKINK